MKEKRKRGWRIRPVFNKDNYLHLIIVKITETTVKKKGKNTPTVCFVVPSIEIRWTDSNVIIAVGKDKM